MDAASQTMRPFLHLTQFSAEQQVKSYSFPNGNALKLLPGNGLHQLDSLSPNEPARVISVVGDTHVGKSTLIRKLNDLNDGEQLGPLAAQANESSMNPNTADINGYLNTLKHVLFLDVEGSGGGNVLPTEASFSLPSDMTESQYFELRRIGVQEQLPRLAYAISDIVIFVALDDFANYSYISRVKQMARHATHDVLDLERPTLILVCNQTRLAQPVDVEEVTNTFFSTHDAELTLLDSFESVKCVRLPDFSSSEGKELFWKQIAVLQNLISSMLQCRLQQRERLGNTYSQLLWGRLVSYTLAQFHEQEVLRIGLIMLQSLLSSMKSYAKKARRYLNESNWGRDYELADIKKDAVSLIACLTAGTVLKAHTNLGDALLKSEKFTEIRAKGQLLARAILPDDATFNEVFAILTTPQNLNKEKLTQAFWELRKKARPWNSGCLCCLSKYSATVIQASLPCGHTFCENCKVLISNGGYVPSVLQPGLFFDVECPDCRYILY